MNINGSVADALRSPGASFLSNSGTGSAPSSFIVRANLGRVVGTKGEATVKVVVSSDGRVITAYPVR